MKDWIADRGHTHSQLCRLHWGGRGVEHGNRVANQVQLSTLVWAVFRLSGSLRNSVSLEKILTCRLRGASLRRQYQRLANHKKVRGMAEIR